MAQASMKDIKQRIRSVENTMQITKAMQLVASSKLRGARTRMEASRPFLDRAHEAMEMLAAGQRNSKSPYLLGTASAKRCAVVIGGDRGLAGSYNVNVFKLAEDYAAGGETCILPLGRKAIERYTHGGIECLPSPIEKVDGVEFAACMQAARTLMRGFKRGDFGEVCIFYTTFRSVLTQKPMCVKVLPIQPGEAMDASRQMLFEQSVDSLLEHFLPQYLSGILYAVICDSVVSEQAARRVAMDAATNNASEMIEDLTLKYNRARQSSITQELTEIVAGAEH